MQIYKNYEKILRNQYRPEIQPLTLIPFEVWRNLGQMEKNPTLLSAWQIMHSQSIILEDWMKMKSGT